MNFICYGCSEVLNRRDYYMVHLKRHNLIVPYLCKQGDCVATFYDYKALNRHLKKYHSNINEAPIPVLIDSSSKNSVINANLVDDIEFNSNAPADVEMENLEDIDNLEGDYMSISRKAFKIAIGFKARSRISQSVLNEFLTTFDDFYGEITDMILKIFVTTHRNVISSEDAEELKKK